MLFPQTGKCQKDRYMVSVLLYFLYLSSQKSLELNKYDTSFILHLSCYIPVSSAPHSNGNIPGIPPDLIQNIVSSVVMGHIGTSFIFSFGIMFIFFHQLHLYWKPRFDHCSWNFLIITYALFYLSKTHQVECNQISQEIGATLKRQCLPLHQ